MFNFRKKNDSNDDDNMIPNEEMQEQNDNDVFDITSLFEQLEYTNSYLAQLNMIQGELLKQQTIANALAMLDHQYKHADGFMSVDEIQDKYMALAGEIFADYQSNKSINNLEEKN